MKKNLVSLLVLLIFFVFVGCVNINFDMLNGDGKLKVENNSQDAIKAFVMYTEENGEYVEAYRNDGVYAEEGDSPVSVNIKSGEYAEYTVASGEYDILFFMVYNGYWYCCEKEDIDVFMNNTTTVSVESGEWSLLIPSKASSMYDKLPEVVKTQIFQ